MGLRIPAAGGWEPQVDSASREALGLSPTALLLPQSTVPELSYLGIVCVFAYIVGHSIGPSEFLHISMGDIPWGPVSSCTPQWGTFCGVQ